MCARVTAVATAAMIAVREVQEAAVDGVTTAPVAIGALDVWALHDGRFTLPAPPGFPAVGSEGFADHVGPTTADGAWVMEIGAFLVRSGDRLLLVDAGAGPADGAVRAPQPFADVDGDLAAGVVRYFRERGLDDDATAATIAGISRSDISHGALAASLRATGFEPSDVTDVVLSHLHHDHIGWVSHDGEPCFPNATVRFERRDAEYFLAPDHDDAFYTWMSGAPPTMARMGPVLDRSEPWDGDTTIAPGVDVRLAAGHTPGSCLVVLSSGDQRALVLGDTVHCPLEVADPDFSIMSDMDPELAERTREQIRRELDDGTTMATAPHFAGLRFGRLLPGTGRRRWRFEGT